jgi:hypothetical protein
LGYYVKKLPNKKSLPHWKVQFISWRQEDTKTSKAKKPKREWDISKDRWHSLGFVKTMTFKEAKSRARQLNCQEKIKRQEEQIIKIIEVQKEFGLRHDAVFPSEFVAEFEERFIRKKDSQVEQQKRKRSRAYTRWRAAQKLIVDVGLEPSEWFLNQELFYNYFCREKMSIKYSSSILNIANLWGFYYSKKLARPFLRVMPPRGYEKERIISANLEKTNVKRASKQILPKDLERVRTEINQANFNWLYISVWFGLRPKEVDNLTDLSLWKVETLSNGRKILWVFQTKIVALPREDRWKPIPIIFEEQKFALRMIEGQNFKRPIAKTMRKYFGRGTDCYGGRKGFPDLMLSKNQTFENISVWMGHSTLQRTWYSYKSRRRFHVLDF